MTEVQWDLWAGTQLCVEAASAAVMAAATMLTGSTESA
jgi:hypothetical protein